MKITALTFTIVCVAAIARGEISPAPVVAPADMALVEGGAYIPMFGELTEPRSVKPFYLDRHPVTNAQFLKFVRQHPKWQQSQVSKTFASESYLAHWQDDLELGPSALPDAPVVNVSWFAARAYLKAHDKRLPSEDEWEFAARADETRANAANDPAFLTRILEWYTKPTPSVLPSVTTASTDFRGITGMHGLVWEWTNDFNNQMVTGAARNDTSLDRSLFCAGGALNATDAANYAAFMRYAFRSSLEGNSTIGSLGFRGARDIHPQP